MDGRTRSLWAVAGGQVGTPSTHPPLGQSLPACWEAVRGPHRACQTRRGLTVTEGPPNVTSGGHFSSFPRGPWLPCWSWSFCRSFQRTVMGSLLPTGSHSHRQGPPPRRALVTPCRHLQGLRPTLTRVPEESGRGSPVCVLPSGSPWGHLGDLVALKGRPGAGLAFLLTRGRQLCSRRA